MHVHVDCETKLRVIIVITSPEVSYIEWHSWLIAGEIILSEMKRFNSENERKMVSLIFAAVIKSERFVKLNQIGKILISFVYIFNYLSALC